MTNIKGVNDIDITKYNYLFYVEKYSIFSNDYELYVYAAKTNDPFHTIGEMYYRSMEHIKRITKRELTSKNRDSILEFWEKEEKHIYIWKDIYPKHN